eukprot:TRINITY_DN340_c0_g1_i2.p2 TRINITY_DN340_c0_g1~~TRINITY_DN340_c0_g1_i2.p2  ORF type:complete len:232 (+),score=111.52 TRINITY_DN340_c0_g1_i2:39-734(+)
MSSAGSTNSKRSSMTLDLSSGDCSSSKKAAKMSQILTSPDVQMLKLSSPELTEFLSRNPSLHTPSPYDCLFNRSVTEEQKIYAKGFEEALQKLHSESPNGGKRKSGETDSEEAASSIPDEDIRIKEEPLDSLSNSSNNLEPIDMESQEKIKLERKRLRNRVAASKCRKRKLERISQLDDKVNQLKNENVDLGTVIKRLKEEVCDLKQEVMKHIHSGCDIMINGEQPPFNEA